MTINVPRMAVETTRELFRTLIQHGCNEQKLIEISGIDVRQLEKSEIRFPVSQHLDLWKAGERLLPDHGIGLHIGSQSNPHYRGIVGLSFACGRNLLIAVQNKIRYTSILADHISLEFTQQNDHFCMEYGILEEYFHVYEIERVFAGFLNWVRAFVGQNIYPFSLSFEYPEPSYVEVYNKYFNCPLSFNQPNNMIYFPACLLATENSEYNDYLYSVLKMRAENVLQKLDTTIDFVSGVRATIAGRLSQGSFMVDDMAASVNMSRRTFHRKLSQHNVTYQELLDDVRKQMAISYLNEGECDYHSIPYLLGYADMRGFTRAFRRWMNCSPKEYAKSK